MLYFKKTLSLSFSIFFVLLLVLSCENKTPSPKQETIKSINIPYEYCWHLIEKDAASKSLEVQENDIIYYGDGEHFSYVKKFNTLFDNLIEQAKSDGSYKSSSTQITESDPNMDESGTTRYTYKYTYSIKKKDNSSLNFGYTLNFSFSSDDTYKRIGFDFTQYLEEEERFINRTLTFEGRK